MKTENPEAWDRLRAAYRPPEVSLDTASIMNAIRREAAARPLHRTATSPVTAIPTWVCAMAASLALLATVTVVSHSITAADRQISEAWLQNVQPDEFAQNFVPFADDSSL